MVLPVPGLPEKTMCSDRSGVGRPCSFRALQISIQLIRLSTSLLMVSKPIYPWSSFFKSSMLSAGVSSSCFFSFSFCSVRFTSAGAASVTGTAGETGSPGIVSCRDTGLMPHKSSLSSCIRWFSRPCMISFCIWMISSLRSICRRSFSSVGQPDQKPSYVHFTALFPFYQGFGEN